MDVGNGETMMIRFKTTASAEGLRHGQETGVERRRYLRVTTVEELRHYARTRVSRRKKSKRSRKKRNHFRFEADGVLLYE